MTRVKICGMTDPDVAKKIGELGVDMIGAIVDVDVETPREVSSSQAGKIFKATPSTTEKVVVSMLTEVDEGVNIVEKLDPDYLQIHNYIDPAKMKRIREETGKAIVSVIGIPKEEARKEEIFEKVVTLSTCSDILLLDTASQKGGGSGNVHNWNLSREIRRNTNLPIMLAGGLNHRNVGRAIGVVDPFAVDLSSGVESEPGKKDIDKVKKALEEVPR